MIEIPTGWLAPDGELWECDYYEHAAVAEEICEKLQLYCDPYSRKGSDDCLLSNGWVKLGISSLGQKRYRVHWEKFLTDYQRNFLKKYFENEKDLKFPMCSTSLCKFLYEDEFFESR